MTKTATLVLVIASWAGCAAGCGSEGTDVDIAKMKNKLLSMAAVLKPGGFISVELIADGCPTLHEDAFLKINGSLVPVDDGMNTTPGPFQPPCVFPGGNVSLSSLPDLGTTFTVEIGDSSQVVRAVLAPFPAGPVQFMAPLSTSVKPGGEVVVPFTVSGASTAATTLPYAYGVFEDLTGPGPSWWSSGSIDELGVHFQVPATAPAMAGFIRVQAGLVSVCENADCDATSVSVAPDFQPQPTESQFDVTVGPS